MSRKRKPPKPRPRRESGWIDRKSLAVVFDVSDEGLRRNIIPLIPADCIRDDGTAYYARGAIDAYAKYHASRYATGGEQPAPKAAILTMITLGEAYHAALKTLPPFINQKYGKEVSQMVMNFSRFAFNGYFAMLPMASRKEHPVQRAMKTLDADMEWIMRQPDAPPSQELKDSIWAVGGVADDLDTPETGDEADTNG